MLDPIVAGQSCIPLLHHQPLLHFVRAPLTLRTCSSSSFNPSSISNTNHLLHEALNINRDQQRRRTSSSRRSSQRRCTPTCSLTILHDHTLRRLLPSQFTGDQWKYYWGITESDRFGKIYEAASFTFFGLWTSWFLTFMIGVPLATCLGTIFLFYWILAPGLAAYRRNQAFHRGSYFARHEGDSGIFGALFSGRVVRVGRITQSREYNRPEAIVMSVEDDEGRKLRVYAPVLPSYRSIRPGMRCEGVVLSDSPDFDELLGVTDIFVPAVPAWVGDYPYLDKEQFKSFLSQKLKKEKKRILKRQKEELGGSLLLESGTNEEWMDADEIWDAGLGSDGRRRRQD